MSDEQMTERVERISPTPVRLGTPFMVRTGLIHARLALCLVHTAPVGMLCSKHRVVFHC